MVYNCHTVFNAISQAGCTPVFLDVRDDLTLDLDDLRSVLEQYFGIPADDPPLHDLDVQI